MFICMTADSRGQRTEFRFSQYLHSRVTSRQYNNNTTMKVLLPVQSRDAAFVAEELVSLN